MVLNFIVGRFKSLLTLVPKCRAWIILAIFILSNFSIVPTYASLENELINQAFIGKVTIQDFSGRYLVPLVKEGDIQIIVKLGGKKELSTSSTPFSWNVIPSPRHGGYFLYAILDEQPLLYWQCHPKDEYKIKLHDGNDDWETFRLKKHPMGGWAFYSVISKKFLASEPNGRLVADRPDPGKFERFEIKVEEWINAASEVETLKGELIEQKGKYDRAVSEYESMLPLLKQYKSEELEDAKMRLETALAAQRETISNLVNIIKSLCRTYQLAVPVEVVEIANGIK